MLKYSGFLLISMSIASSRIKESRKKFLEVMFFILSVVTSFIGNFNVPDFPIEQIVHSTLMKIGINMIGKITVMAILLVKVSNMLFGFSFMKVLMSLQFVHKKVKKFKNFLARNMKLIATLFQLQLLKIESLSGLQKAVTLSVAVVQTFYIIIFLPSLGMVFDKMLFGGKFNLEVEIFFFMSILWMMLSCVTLMMILTCTYFQMKNFNNFLSELISHPQKKINVKIVIKTSILHDSLCDCSEAISTFYTLTILTILLGFLYFDIIFCFAIFILFKKFSNELFFFTLAGVLWIFYYSPSVVYITTFSSWIEKEGLRTGNLIQTLAINDNHSKRMWIMMQQMTHRSPKISCGMFDVNWKSFFGMLCAIFSFWIIMIQFYDVTN